jgi:hypothetical protein
MRLVGMRLSSIGIALLLLVSAISCGPKQDVIEPGGPPPLPPASGTAIGYLIDAKRDLSLRDDQLAKLKDLDDSLAAQNGSLDAQLRQIEKPVPAEQLSPQQQKAGEKTARYNNAPGVSTITTEDSQKLRRERDGNEREAIQKAFALLDPDQLTRAKRILIDRGVTIPGEKDAQPVRSEEDGTPLPGMDQ